MRCCTAFVIISQFTYIDPISQKMISQKYGIQRNLTLKCAKKTILSQKQQSAE